MDSEPTLPGSESRPGSFELLTPETATFAIESAFDLRLDGLLVPYPSYINRVYGIRDEEGAELVVKFYRPDRWTEEAIRDEHRFLLDCSEEELPVVAPLSDGDGETLQILALEAEDQGADYLLPFALFPKMGGRNFDPETDEEWHRLGALAGRLHQVARKREAASRVVCDPELTAGFAEELLAGEIVHPAAAEEFRSICAQTLDGIRPLFAGVSSGRLHGDLHRGNILDRPGTGLVVFDFDDMMTGPAVQDLWLLLPGRIDDSRRELELLLGAYEEFLPLDRAELRLIEPLRFMRMVYFLAWRARQRHDYWFQSSFPEWGSKAFWLKEMEDLRDQARVIDEQSE